MKFFLKVYGCKVNQYEGQQIREAMLNCGHDETSSPSDADIIILRICAVTAGAEKEAVSYVRKTRRAYKDAAIVVCGCVTDSARAMLAEWTGHVYPLNSDKEGIGFTVQGTTVDLGNFKDRVLEHFSGHTRAFLKVQEGCGNSCAYCIVSRLRGPGVSRPVEQVKTSFRHLIENGYKEIVLCGTHLGSYSCEDCAGPAELVRVLTAELSGDYRIRLSSMEPQDIDPESYAALMQDNRLCPHLHIPIQSGSDRILKLMGRRYDRGYITGLVSGMRERVPSFGLSTDLICGFPGETGEDFQETARLVEEVRFMRVHVFPFSPRPGTAAETMTPRVPEYVVKERCSELRRLAARTAEQARREQIGSTLRVLVEKKDKDRASGLSENYFPVEFSGGEVSLFSSVRITGTTESHLVGG